MRKSFDQSRKIKKVTTNQTDSKIRNQPELAVKNHHPATLKHATAESAPSHYLSPTATYKQSKKAVHPSAPVESSSSCYGYPSD